MFLNGTCLIVLLLLRQWCNWGRIGVGKMNNNNNYIYIKERERERERY